MGTKRTEDKRDWTLKQPDRLVRTNDRPSEKPGDWQHLNNSRQ